MDAAPIVYQILSTLWFLIPLAIVIEIIRSITSPRSKRRKRSRGESRVNKAIGIDTSIASPQFESLKGSRGESRVNATIRFMLPNTDYHLLTNITLPAENGTTQIDHIIVSRYGIFVIETKNMQGWIFGTPHQKQWTQQLFRHRSQFQNPIHQNYKHVKALETLLNVRSNMIFSIVVFTSNSTIKTPMPDNVTSIVGCIRYVKAHQKVLLSDPEVTDIVNYIEARRFANGLKSNREHVAHVRQTIAEKDNSKNCSRCGSIMKIRTAKQGPHAGDEFWGCSTFPRCRNIESIH
ncbi:MAG: NERD domain-containing protein [Gammaproteobacteria bacterium]